MSDETKTNTTITNPTTIDQMFRECNGIGPFGSTNIHNVLVHTSELKRKYGNTQDMQTISILLSDGYVTSGLSRHQLDELVQSNPEMKYDVTIGIGEETEYDAELLKSITREDDVRGCPCIDDLYDNLLSCIFHKMNIFARNVRFVFDENTESHFKYTTSPDQFECNPFNVPEFRFEQFVGFSTSFKQGSCINIRMSQLPLEVTHDDSSDNSDNIIDCIYGGANNEWKICYTRNRVSTDNDLSTSGIRRYDTDISIELIPERITLESLRNQKIQHHIVTEYMKITKELDSIDMEDMARVNQLYLHLSQWNTDYKDCSNTPTTTKMQTIISEIYRRINHLVELEEERRSYEMSNAGSPRRNVFGREYTDYISYSVDSSGNRTSLLASIYGEPDDLQLPDNAPSFSIQTPQVHTGLYLGDSQSLSEHPSTYTATPYNYNGYRSVQATPSLTPSQTISSIRAMRSQSRQGNYAFIGRMMTESYSQAE
jgi:hypothetical protein